MKSPSEMLGRDGNIPKDEHTKIQPYWRKVPWRKFSIYPNILSKKNKNRIIQLLGGGDTSLTKNRVKVKMLSILLPFYFLSGNMRLSNKDF